LRMKRPSEISTLEAESQSRDVLLKSLKTKVQGLMAQKEDAAKSSERARLADEVDLEAMKKYQARLATFEFSSRFNKPRELNPCAFARAGWKSLGDDNLKCDDCGNATSALIPSADTLSARVMAVNIRKVLRLLEEAHDVQCEWRTKRLNISKAYDVNARYTLLIDASINKVPLVKGAIDESQLCEFPQSDRFCLTAAASGWTPISSDKLDCGICGRKLFLPVFSADNPLNFLEQHYCYCPVVDKEYPLWKESLEKSIPPRKEKGTVLEGIRKAKLMLKGLFAKRSKDD